MSFSPFLVEPICPLWRERTSVRACFTQRVPGHSFGAYAGFNLGLHVGDDVAAVEQNRLELMHHVGRPLLWLNQVHGVEVADQFDPHTPTADAAIATSTEYACVVMTADCLPILLCDKAGTCVAAAHAGWRGLASGIIERTVEKMPARPAQLSAWLGPAISQAHFEVGAEVRDMFMSTMAEAASAFIPSPNAGRFMADIYQLARLRLTRLGVTDISGGEYCTVRDAAQFYSYRRDGGVTGRMASVIWLQP